MPYVYPFDHRHDRAPRTLAGLLGGKGANLAEMAAVLRLPVPPGFTISTDACRHYLADGWPTDLDTELAEQLGALEKTMGKGLGAKADPLLVSVRSGAELSMPGMMDTILNLGLNDRSVEALAELTGDERFAYDSYRRFVSMYGRIVLGVDGAVFDRDLDAVRDGLGVERDADVPADALRQLVARYLAAVEADSGAPFPQAPLDQLRGAVGAVFDSWNGTRAVAYRARERIPQDLGTAVTVQAMVFGNRDERSGTGVGFTRDPATGAPGEYGDFLLNAQGEDVVAGTRTTLPLVALGREFPSVFSELKAVFARLEAHYHDMCDVEFTIESGKLWLLQTRVGKRTGRAALRMAVDMTTQGSWRISRAEAVARITADHIDQVLHPQFAASPSTLLTTGLPASPGAAVGRVCFDVTAAITAARSGEAVILVRAETSPEDVAGMIAAQGILTARGGLVSHAAVVARGWGKPAVVGAAGIRIGTDAFRVGDTVVAVGDVISIDGASGEVALGAVELSAAEPPAEMGIVLGWADAIRAGRLAVRANADNGPDAANARRFGAEGIGLCRTEHMFLAEDRLPIMRRMILAEGADEEAAALEELREAQKADFGKILAAMDGLAVTVRLLDPPLHEFLPPTEALQVKRATLGLDDDERRLLGVAQAWHEVNPMIGTRGVRLGVIKPGLYAMQVRALVQAAVARIGAGGSPHIEIMIPLTVSRPELALARRWVTDAVAAETAGLPDDVVEGLDITIGTMVETPRAAITAAEMAREADFFSFGTNDLTQMTFGFSRDDVEGRLMKAYIELGLLERNPFETIDIDGVGALINFAVGAGRDTSPALEIGICGEHGGDPESIDFFYRMGVDYVSCSPYRVPIARLAAAHAVLAASKVGR